MYVAVLNYQDRTFSIVHHGLQVGIIKIKHLHNVKGYTIGNTEYLLQNTRNHASLLGFSLIPLRRTIP